MSRTPKSPLVSIKFSEIPQDQTPKVMDCIERFAAYQLIVHDYSTSNFASSIINNAEKVMGLNSEITAAIRSTRSDVVSGFTVASYEAPELPDDPELKLITFGMAHKIQSRGYLRVAELLQKDSRTHILEISSALHEGGSFDDSYFEVGDEIAGFFRGRVRFLGFLADPEVSLRVSRASAMIAFFPSGARENNNSVVSAMHLSVPVITNLDDWSPPWLSHGESVFDIDKLDAFPSDIELRRIGEGGRKAVQNLTYSNLMSRLASRQ